MEKIAIITDSCSDLKEEYRKENNIFVLPIQISCDGKTYRDGIDISFKRNLSIAKRTYVKNFITCWTRTLFVVRKFKGKWV